MGKPEIRFKGYTDEWEQRKLGDVAEFSKGSGYSKGDLIESGTPIILYGRLYTKYETIISDVDTFVEAKDGSVYSKGGEVIVPASGETAEDIARAASVDKSGILLGGDLNVVMPNEDINSIFLAISISNGSSQRELARKAQGKSVVHIHNEEIRNLIVPFPTKTEQNKIENYFADLDHLITLHQRKCAEIKSLKKYMLQKMFPQNEQKVPEIRFEGFTEAWEQRKLKDIIEYIVDNRGKNPPYYCSEGIPVIDNFMIQNTLYPDLQTATRFIDSALYNDFIRKYNEEDDTLLTLVGNGIGNITLFPKEKAVIIQNTLGFRAKKNRKFLFFLLMANNEKLLKLDRGMAQPSIRQDEILDIDIHVPSESEQTEIGKYFTSIDNLITLHQQKCEELKKIKKFMLQKMFV